MRMRLNYHDCLTLVCCLGRLLHCNAREPDALRNLLVEIRGEHLPDGARALHSHGSIKRARCCGSPAAKPKVGETEQPNSPHVDPGQALEPSGHDDTQNVSLPSRPKQSARGAAWKAKQQLKAQQRAGDSSVGSGKKRRKGGDREFDHSCVRRRNIAVQLMYEGETYAGFCSQVRHASHVSCSLYTLHYG